MSSGDLVTYLDIEQAGTKDREKKNNLRSVKERDGMLGRFLASCQGKGCWVLK